MAKDTRRKDGRQMEWLYTTPQVDREQYLLGRKIDKQVDPLLASEEREKQALASGPGALFLGADAAGSTADLAAKVKEDPLFLIRKKEEEARQRLASNPVKMKQLQQLFAEEKSSKSRKRRDRSRSPVKKKHSHRQAKTSHKHKREPPAREHLSPPASSPSVLSARPTSRSAAASSSGRSRGSVLSREELDRRRREMMENAESHGREREQRLRRMEHDRQKEEEASQTAHSQDFLQPLRVQSMAAAGSVEERIHRSIGSVQRTRNALDSNFLHK